MDDKYFEALVVEALDSLPQKFKNILNNVDIVIEDEPTIFQRRKMRLRPWSTLFGLYEGIPLTNRRNYTQVLPDKITIFKNSFEFPNATDDVIKGEVRRTVLHEIGHHFGMSDSELRKISY